jgi:hypothetical protein
MGTGPIIAYVFHPMYLRFVEQVQADLVVYGPYDLFSKMPDWSDERSAEEQRLLELCGLVIASSEPTRSALQQKTTKPVFCVPNGSMPACSRPGQRCRHLQTWPRFRDRGLVMWAR